MSFLSKLFGQRATHRGPSIVAHEAFGGAIRVLETPTTAGWNHDETQRTGDGYSVMVLKYILPMSPMPLALLAKIYTIEATCPAPEAPSQTDWKTVYKATFSTFTGVETKATQQLTMKSAIEAVEASIDGIGVDPAVPLRIRERRSVVAHEQFIVTAIGPPSAFEEHAAEIAQWFETAAFVPMGDLPRS